MSLIKCKECNNEISNKAKVCPKCGAKNKEKLSIVFKIIIGFFLCSFIIIIFLLTLPKQQIKTNNIEVNNTNNIKATESPEIPETKIYNENQQVNIDYTSYIVKKSYYSTKLSDNQFMQKKPDGIYLFVDLLVINNDKNSITIPQFSLVDNDKEINEYKPSSMAYMLKNAIGLLSPLNPKLQKNGLVVFDVPKGKTFQFVLYGAYPSSKYALVNLNPK